MKLNLNELNNKKLWIDANISIPSFDIEKIVSNTKKNPTWIHFGAGNIFRAFIANSMQTLIEKKLSDTGIIVADGYDQEIIDKVFTPYDNLSLLVTLKADGSINKKVIASITESLKTETFDNDFNRLIEIFENNTLQMVSFTITEKGYNLINQSGNFREDVLNDFNMSKDNIAESYIGKITQLLLHRYNKGKFPVALVSMDNCSHNGDKLYEAVLKYADVWTKNGFAEKGFLEYISNPKVVSFPWTMIDKITPRPDESVKKMLEEVNFTDTDIFITKKQTYIAPYVNAEEMEYLVIEDNFPNGRPKLEKANTIFTDRETVDKVEKMKVCTCLNPLHTALAIFGCLLSYKKISDEMKDKDLLELVKRIGYVEGLPVVVDPKIIDPKRFIDDVIEIRLPNPFMPDTPQRISTDTSQKLAIRFGETIKAYSSSKNLKITDLKLIPLVLAAWCRYLLGKDDDLVDFTVSPDPMYDKLKTQLKTVEFDKNVDYCEVLKPILSNRVIFGVNLYEVGLGKKVEEYFHMMLSKNAIRKTLIDTLNN